MTQTLPLDNGRVEAKASLTASSIPAPASTATFQTLKDFAQDWSLVHCLLPQTLQGPSPVQWMKMLRIKQTQGHQAKASVSPRLTLLGTRAPLEMIL